MLKSFLVSFLFLIAFQVLGFVPSNPDSSVFLKNDGFRQVEARPTVFLAPLPDKVKETSGLIFWRNALWTHNDSGGKPELYKIDTATGKISQTIILDGIMANDWEDVAQDNDFIYVGDFGNNGGDRKDLCIYKIPKSVIPLSEKVVRLSPSTLKFSFADQTVFENNFRKNDFDCEAFFAFGDSLYLFSKNWVDGNTRMYVLPKIAGDFKVLPRAAFPADGLVTGADVNPANDEVALIGYKDFQPFMWLFWDFGGNDFFGGEKLRVDFPDLIFVQTEGIAFLDDDKIVYSAEKSIIPQSVFTVTSSGLKSLAEKASVQENLSTILISDISKTFSGKIIFEVIKVPADKFSVVLSSRNGKKLCSEKFDVENSNLPFSVNIPVEKLKSGNYAIKIISGGQTLVRKVKIKN